MTKQSRVKETVKVYFGGRAIKLNKGIVYPTDSEMVKGNIELFELIKEVKKPKNKEVKKKAKEEILIEKPVSELKVEIEEEVKVKEIF